jgi:hypothetical protein
MGLGEGLIRPEGVYVRELPNRIVVSGFGRSMRDFGKRLMAEWYKAVLCCCEMFGRDFMGVLLRAAR